MTGRIHSFESMGGADGPGVRFVVFMQGCPFRCVYCHNPDTWDFGGGTEYTPQEVARRALRMKPYFGGGGGVTISGGEVLMQADFTAELFSLLRAEGIHTAIDTSGGTYRGDVERLLSFTDLVICDIKFTTNAQYRDFCGAEFERVREFLKLTEKKKIPLWIRQVIVPGLTDSEEAVRAMAEEARKYGNLQKIELLPFRKLCTGKYERMGIAFPLAGTPECTEETVRRLFKATIFSS